MTREKVLKADDLIYKIFRYISYAAGVAVAAIAILATINVITSKITRNSIPSANDWITYLLIPVVYLSLAHVQLDRGMVRVDFIANYLPKIINNIIEFISYIGCCALNLFIGSRAFTLMFSYLETSKMSSTSRGAFPLWPFPLILGVGMMVFALSDVWCLIRMILLRGEKVVRNAPAPEEGGENA